MAPPPPHRCYFTCEQAARFFELLAAAARDDGAGVRVVVVVGTTTTTTPPRGSSSYAAPPPLLTLFAFPQGGDDDGGAGARHPCRSNACMWLLAAWDPRRRHWTHMDTRSKLERSLVSPRKPYEHARELLSSSFHHPAGSSISSAEETGGVTLAGLQLQAASIAAYALWAMAVAYMVVARRGFPRCILERRREGAAAGPAAGRLLDAMAAMVRASLEAGAVDLARPIEGLLAAAAPGPVVLLPVDTIPLPKHTAAAAPPPKKKKRAKTVVAVVTTLEDARARQEHALAALGATGTTEVRALQAEPLDPALGQVVRVTLASGEVLRVVCATLHALLLDGSSAGFLGSALPPCEVSDAHQQRVLRAIFAQGFDGGWPADDTVVTVHVARDGVVRLALVDPEGEEEPLATASFDSKGAGWIFEQRHPEECAALGGRPLLPPAAPRGGRRKYHVDDARPTMQTSGRDCTRKLRVASVAAMEHARRMTVRDRLLLQCGFAHEQLELFADAGIYVNNLSIVNVVNNGVVNVAAPPPPPPPPKVVRCESTLAEDFLRLCPSAREAFAVRVGGSGDAPRGWEYFVRSPAGEGSSAWRAEPLNVAARMMAVAMRDCADLLQLSDEEASARLGDTRACVSVFEFVAARLAASEGDGSSSSSRTLPPRTAAAGGAAARATGARAGAAPPRVREHATAREFVARMLRQEDVPAWLLPIVPQAFRDQVHQVGGELLFMCTVLHEAYKAWARAADPGGAPDSSIALGAALTAACASERGDERRRIRRCSKRLGTETSRAFYAVSRPQGTTTGA